MFVVIGFIVVIGAVLGGFTMAGGIFPICFTHRSW